MKLWLDEEGVPHASDYGYEYPRTYAEELWKTRYQITGDRIVVNPTFTLPETDTYEVVDGSGNVVVRYTPETEEEVMTSNMLNILDITVPQGYEFRLTKTNVVATPYKVSLVPIEEGFEISENVFALHQIEESCKSLVRKLHKAHIDAQLEKGHIVIGKRRL